jgi:hypothetical protein
MAVANMILNIVTRGDMASLKASIDMVVMFAGKIAGAMKAVDDFADAHTRLSSDVGLMIERTNGLVKGVEAFTTANKLSQAGIKASKEQLGNLAVAATEYAQATGQDIPAAMNQMAEAVISGSERGLRKFGIDVSDAKDKTQAQTMALDALGKQFGDTVVQIDSFSNMASALSNNLEDATMRMLEASAASAGFAAIFYDLNKELTEFNVMMEESPQATADWATDVHNILLSVSADWGNYFATVAEGLLGADNAIAKWLREAAAATNQAVTARNLQRVLESIPEKKQREEQRQQRQAAMAAPKRSGGGGKKKAMASMDFSESESEASYQGSLDPLLGEAPDRWAGVGGNVDEMEAAARFAETQAGYAKRLEEAIKSTVETRKEALDVMRLNMEVDKSAAGIAMSIDERIAQMEAAAQSREIDKQIEADPRVRALELAAEREATLEYYDQSLDYAERFGDSWGDALQRTSAGAMVAAGTQNLLRGAVTQAANAIVGSSKLTVKAMAEMVKGVALSVGIEATILGLIELGHMIAAIASSWGMSPEVEMHAAALAQYAITAAAAFAVAGAASAVSSSAKGASSASPTGTKTGQGQYGSPGYQDVSGGGNQNVTIVLEGDAEGIFRVVRKENQKRSYSGSGSFAEQAA